MIYAVTALIIVIVLFTLYLLFYAKKLPIISKGAEGERIVARILGKTVPGKQYVINDLLLDLGDGKSCQIDHIFINTYGIWVIETKNYSGSISGCETDSEWTQVLADGRIVNKLYNPVKQNSSHIYHLSKLLRAYNVFHNVVVFMSGADVSGVSSCCVYTLEEIEKIKTQRTGITLSIEEMEYCHNTLLKLKRERKMSQRKHIKNIRNMQTKLEKGICPRCGGKLLMKKGENGLYHYCSNYPSCKFTKPVNDETRK